MYDVETIEYMLDLPIGTRFYFGNHLYEVVESKEGDFCCSKCAFCDSEKELCLAMNCNEGARYYYGYERHDKKYIFFKEVEEIEGENNG